MSIYKLELSYKGTHYLGWQKQKDFSNTVQGQLEKALVKISKSNDVWTVASGRTDAGVHALGQIVKVQMKLNLNPDELSKALNSLLPKDIVLNNLERCEESFQPVFDASSKEYLYVFKQGPSAFSEEFFTSHKCQLDFDKMKKACELLRGEHDFINYMCVGTPVKSTLRTIFECDLSGPQNFEFKDMILKDVYVFRIKGSGFLKQMVRLIVGALWKLGESKISLEEFKDSLSQKKESKLGPVAPAKGLYLHYVSYS